MDKTNRFCSPDEELPSVYKKFSDYDMEAIPILDSENHVYGMMEKFAVDHYIHNRILELHRKIDSLG